MLKCLTNHERVKFIETLNDILDSWDGTVETGPGILEELNLHVEYLKSVQLVEEKNDRPPYNPKESQLLIDIYRKEKLLVHVLKMKKQRDSSKMNDFNEKSKRVYDHLFP